LQCCPISRSGKRLPDQDFGLRLREIFFVLCLLWVALRLTCINPVRPDTNLISLSIAYFASAGFGALPGYYNGYRAGAILAELKALSYFPMLFFFL